MTQLLKLPNKLASDFTTQTQPAPPAKPLLQYKDSASFLMSFSTSLLRSFKCKTVFKGDKKDKKKVKVLEAVEVQATSIPMYKSKTSTLLAEARYQCKVKGSAMHFK